MHDDGQKEVPDRRVEELIYCYKEIQRNCQF